MWARSQVFWNSIWSRLYVWTGFLRMLPFRNVTGDDYDYSSMMVKTMILNWYTILKPSIPIKFSYFWQIERDKVNTIFFSDIFLPSSSLVPKLPIDGGDDYHNNRRRFPRETTASGQERVESAVRIRRRRPRLLWWWCGGEQVAVMMTITGQFLWTKMLTFVDLRV